MTSKRKSAGGASAPTPTSAADFLSRHTPFDRLDPGATAFLAERLTPVCYARNSVVVSPGHGKARAFYIVERGRVQSEQPRGEHPTGQHFLTLGPGECFPLGALVEGRSVSNTYFAVDDTVLYQLPADDFQALLEMSPAFHRFCTRQLASLLQQTRRLLQTHYSYEAAEQQSMSSPLRALVGRTPVTCPPDTAIGDVLRMMQSAKVGSMIVAGPDGAPLGIFTQQDLIGRVLLAEVPLSAPIAKAMTPNPFTLPASASAHEAVLAMAKYGFRHVLVVEEGRLIGLISERDLFSMQRVSLRQVSDTIEIAETLEDLQQAAEDIRNLARNMLAQGVAAEQLTGFISALNDKLTVRIIDIELTRHPLAGIPFCWIALGSEGRLEQTFSSDQDNGIIFDQPGDLDRETVRARLLEFAREVNRVLDACGYPLCRGNIMASNPQWCLTLAEWQGKFGSWVRAPEPEALLNSTIFFDFRPLFGQMELAEKLREWLLAVAQESSLFLRFMAQNALDTKPPLGLLRDFVVENSTIDLKLYGSRPFVDAARIYSLAGGIAHTNTAQRLRLAQAKLRSHEDEIAAMIEGFYFIQQLRLRNQTGQGAGNLLNPDDLNELDRRILKESFRQARKLQSHLALEYHL